jgi:ferredoxin--NADP+ reductase
LVHGVRTVGELAYREFLTETLAANEWLGEVVRRQLHYHPTVTREPFVNMGRISDLLSSGQLAAACGLPPLDPAHDRAMLCGSPAMLKDLKQILEQRGFTEGNTSRPGDFVIERAFVEA